MASRMVARLVLVGVSALVATTACSGAVPRVSESPNVGSRSNSRVPLIAAPTQLRTDCAEAANRLDFAVPCPSQVPVVAGRGVGCPAPREVMPAPCVGFEGLPAYPVFAWEVTGFDVPRGYVGVDGKAMGHLMVEARPQRDRPPRPCIGGTRLGNVTVVHWTATEWRCPNDSVLVQREAMHGEGAHAGHLLFEWSQNGIDYVASAHGHTSANRELLKRLVSSMTLISPGTS